MLEPYTGPTIILYRGEISAQFEKDIFGLSWTSDISMAGMFAEGLNCLPPSGGVLIQSMVPAKAIISSPSKHSKHLQEYEFVVDPRGLIEVLEVRRFPWTK